jgi:hypothetical protein
METSFAKRLIILSLLTILSFVVSAQKETLVIGQVFDRFTQKPVAGATVQFKNTSISTITGNEGYFLIKTNNPAAKMTVFANGYKPFQIRIKQNSTLGVDVWLSPIGPAAIPLEKVNEDSASHRIVQNSILRRTNNSPPSGHNPSTVSDRLKAYAYNVPPNWMNDINARKASVWSPDSLFTVPLFISDKIYRQPGFPSVRLDKDMIRNNQITILPLEKEYVEKMLLLLTLQQNFYKEHVKILGKYFLSPLAKKAFKRYAFFLQDSSIINKRKCYTIGFRPKQRDALLLTGSMTIDSLTYGLVTIDASIPKTLPINFAHSFNIKQQFALNKDKWDYSSINTLLVLNLPLPVGPHQKPVLGVIDKELLFSPPKHNDGDLQQIALRRQKESKPNSDSIYSGVIQLNKTRFMRDVKWVTDLMMYQYAHVGKIDVGPINSLYHKNVLDGSTGAFSFRTGESLWKNFSLGATLGYAFDNHTWKLGGQVLYRFPTKDFQQMQFSYSKNAYRTGFSEDILLVNERKVFLSDDNLFSTLLRFKPNYAVNEVRTWKFQYEKEWRREFKTTLTIFDNRYFSNQYVSFVSQGEPVNSILHYGGKLDFRLSNDQLIWDEFFGRRFLSNHFPVFHFQVEGGKYSMNNVTRNYGKIQATVKQSVDFIGGMIYYTGETGCILGEVPFPLLSFSRGNETLFFSDCNFNLMNNLEYVGDKYANLYVDYYSCGLLLKKIPLIRLLNFKEMFSLRVAENGLSKKHLEVMPLPSGSQTLNTPYVEVAAGVYNILSCLGIQSVWRLTHRNDPKANNWGMRVLFYVAF